MYGSPHLVTRLNQDRLRDLQAEALRYQQLRTSRTGLRSRLAHTLLAVAQKLEPELAERQVPVLR